ncbi:MAG: peptide deformylase [Clostridia bacterium]|nr:peptide deformylase [Clostridia bacterium]
MVRTICKDRFLLSRKAEKADKSDLPLGADLMDTLNANAARCIGMACNMIGVPKAIIAVAVGPMRLLMFNPVIVDKKKPFEAEEGCLSLDGLRKCTRYSEITVEYRDRDFVPHRDKYTGWTAQIIQHECDHLNGILI